MSHLVSGRVRSGVTTVHLSPNSMEVFLYHSLRIEEPAA